jgi:hypothetical protein
MFGPSLRCSDLLWAAPGYPVLRQCSAPSLLRISSLTMFWPGLPCALSALPYFLSINVLCSSQPVAYAMLHCPSGSVARYILSGLVHFCIAAFAFSLVQSGGVPLSSGHAILCFCLRTISYTVSFYCRGLPGCHRTESVCPSYLFECMCLCLSLSLSLCLSFGCRLNSQCLSAQLSICVCLSVGSTLRLSVGSTLRLSPCLSSSRRPHPQCLSAQLSVCLSVYGLNPPSVCRLNSPSVSVSV